MMTDTIADMLTRIRNAQIVRKSTVTIPFSKLKLAIANVLQAEEYIGKVSTENTGKKQLIIELLYTDKMPKIRSIVRESKPGHRAYRKADEIPYILNGYGIAVISTSNGIMTDKDARQAGIGGEVLCSVY